MAQIIKSYLLTYLLMELSPSGEAANSAATQEFPSIYGTRRFITMFTRALHWSHIGVILHKIYITLQ
jgi:hypothetical protein